MERCDEDGFECTKIECGAVVLECQAISRWTHGSELEQELQEIRKERGE